MAGVRVERNGQPGRPLLPAEGLLHYTRAQGPLRSIVAGTLANDMHLWKRHEHARSATVAAAGSWKMSAARVRFADPPVVQRVSPLGPVGGGGDRWGTTNGHGAVRKSTRAKSVAYETR